MSNPYQFIGYWGIDSPDQLEAALTNILVAATGLKTLIQVKKSINKLSENYALNGRVAYIGSNPPPSLANKDGIIAALSASGFYDSADAWVKVENNHLTLGREPFGRVPLYWTKQEKVIWFASKLQLLLPLLKTPEVSSHGLYGYSCFSYVPTPLTPVANIFSVAAGTVETWQVTSEHDLTHTTHRYYQWQSASVLIQDEDEAVSQLQIRLKNAVHRQLENLPREPVGVFLSGGLDSSTIAALLVQAGVKVKAYTLDFGLAGVSEVPYAEQVADYLHIPLVKVDATPRRIKQAIQATATALDLPFGDGVTVPLYLLCQAASQETKVIFNGEGGDQLFAGWTNKPLIAAGVYNQEHPGGNTGFTQQYLRTFHRLWGYEERVFQNQINQELSIQPEQWLAEALESKFTTTLLDRLRRATLMLKGAQNIHPRATNLAFSHGLWVRSPFCDIPLSEWTFQIPGEFYLRGACEKYILKRAVESWLPPEVVWREKRGMGVPLTAWCLNELWSEVGYWLNSGILAAEGRWQPQLPLQLIKGEFSAYLRGRRVGEILWLLLMWQVWRRRVLNETVSGYSGLHPFWLPSRFWRWYWKLRAVDVV